MANTSSAKKATRAMARKTEVNKGRRSRVRTYLRKVEEAIASGVQKDAAEALRAVQPEMMRAAQRGIFPVFQRELQHDMIMLLRGWYAKISRALRKRRIIETKAARHPQMADQTSPFTQVEQQIFGPPSRRNNCLA